MKISLDAQLVLEEKKTGIGKTTKEVIDHIIQIPGNQYQLNFFYCRYNISKQKEILDFYKQKGCTLKGYSWFVGAMYRQINKIIPIPYWWLFGRNSDITQFFNYEIPIGVKGKKSTIVHDMCYKACPETVQTKTRMWLERVLEKSCQRADIIITDSNFSKQEIQKYLNIEQDKIKVVYCGVDHSKYHMNLDRQKLKNIKKKYNIDTPYLLYAGTLEPRKNIPFILEVFREICMENNHIQLVIMGKKGWMYDEIFQKVQEYKIDNQVIFTDYILEEEVPYLYYGAEVFLFPSLYEGFGLPVLESMACGTPVIISKEASLPEVGGQAAFYIDIKSKEGIKEMKENIKKILDEHELYHVKQKLCGEQAKKFKWDMAAKTIVNLYEQLLVEDTK